MSTDEKERIWYTITEAANYLRVTRQTVYNFMNEGLLPFYELKAGRGRRLRREDLDSLLERRIETGVEASGDATDGSQDSKDKR